MGKFTKKKKSNIVKSRKELRKEKRQQKKENKRNFFSRKKLKPGQFVHKPPQQHDSEEDEGNAGFEEDVNSEIESDFELSDDEMNAKLSKIKPVPKKAVVSQPDRFLENQQKEKRKEQELQKKMRKRRIEQLKSANEEDDKIIRKLEKKLRIDKHKNDKSVHKMFGDGLDYALELCLPENIEKMYKAAKDAAESDDDSDGAFNEDLAAAIGDDKVTKAKKKKKREEAKESKRMKRLSKAEEKYFKDELDLSGSDSEFGGESDDEVGNRQKLIQDSEDSDFDIMESGEEAEDGENSQDASESGEGENSGEEDEVSGSDLDEGEDDEESGLDDEENESFAEVNDDADGENHGAGPENGDSKIWEDIYGRQRDKDGNIVEEKATKYVPPHVRARLEAENPSDSKRKEKLANLQRHCKGFLNRLSEANIHKIAGDIENLYRSNSRFDMNNTLTKLVSEAIISHVLSPERMVLEYAMLVAVLHANVGNEVGAHVLETLVVKIEKYINNINTLDVENKEFDNTLFLLCHMYTFKIFQHSLIYEILKRLSEHLCEKSVECLLLVLRSVGFQLRKDDPLALKDLILVIQKKASEAPSEVKENARLKFMIEILLAIKNNNMTKIPQYDPSLAEHLKKILKSMMVNGKYVTTLNITIDDLLNADEKGKWWVVGSAWSGNIKDINAAKPKAEQQKTEKFSDQLLALAKQQRMNTEDRKNVFCIIMSAEDYINAFERLLHLAIKDQRVIATVIIHCCLSEKVFNPYYAALAQKFCEYDRKYQLAIQFALWDRIKEVRSGSKQEMKNLAQLLIYLISKGGQPLSVLKVIEFGEMDKSTLRFVRQIMLGLLLGNEEECCQVFARIAPSMKLGLFKDSIRLFIHHFLLKGSKNSDIDPDKMKLLQERISIADEALQTRDSKVKF